MRTSPRRDNNSLDSNVDRVTKHAAGHWVARLGGLAPHFFVYFAAALACSQAVPAQSDLIVGGLSKFDPASDVTESQLCRDDLVCLTEGTQRSEAISVTK